MRHVLSIVALAFLSACAAHDSATFSVASFNVFGAGANDGQSIDATVAVLRGLGADVVAVQEIRAEAARCDAANCPPAGDSRVAEFAAAAGYTLVEQAGTDDLLWANAILTRLPVRATLPGNLGAIVTAGATDIAVFNVHLADFPYQPYQLVGIPYGDAPMLGTATAAVQAAEAARGAAVDRLLQAIEALPADMAVVVCGDFNEPSHRDWSAQAAAAGLMPLAVDFPASRKLEAAGFVDAWRDRFPDEVAHPGHTWTPSVPAGDDREQHDRIDFVYVRHPAVQVIEAVVVGESPRHAGRVIRPWPSDHRAVFVEFGL